jgi:hypothetical protein
MPPQAGGDPAAAMGGAAQAPTAPPGAPPTPQPAPASGGNELQTAVQTAVQQAMAQQGGAGGPGAAVKPPKPDINMVATDVFQLKKMILADRNAQGKPLPPDILDGPGRDPNTGTPTASPVGGSDPSQTQAVPGAGQAGPQAQSAIPPIEPMQGAFPQMPGAQKTASKDHAPGWNKVGSVFGSSLADAPITAKARAVALMIRRREAKE